MKYFQKSDDKIICLLCPRKCNLSNEQTGFCKAVTNSNNTLQFKGYGYSSGFAIDPIEKKPLYHFYPGSQVLSFGTFGCNMGCVFCQNHNISKHSFDINRAVKANPEQIVQTALAYNCKSIAFTYNEPVVFLDYAIETAKLAKYNNIKTVAVTSGYMLLEPAKEFYSYIDAVNIDLKAFSNSFYKKYCWADINYVLDIIKYVVTETNCILELTTLLIDGENNNYKELNQEFEWIINNLGSDTPVHLSAFHPDYKFLNKQQTTEKMIIDARNIAKESGLKFVYGGNVRNNEISVTACPNCGFKLIERDGYNIKNTGLNIDKCINCGQKIYGKFN
ncbi:AmmeMemoRadiSam system radical SAM enzyme [bacterium]|nr:AmmeMemoRadiSam system radical SAM enzyme [bacterium]